MLVALVVAALGAPGSVHQDHALAHLGADVSGAVARRAGPLPLPAVTNGPDRVVYGYEAYWNADLTTVPWDDLSHLAIFSAGTTGSGTLTDLSRWDRAPEAVSIAAAYGVRVHLCVTNFDAGQLSTLLSSATNRATLIANLTDQVRLTGADGVNVDFEGLPVSQRANMVQFVTDLDASLTADNPAAEVVLATPAVDWSGAWAYADLAPHALLFIMGYGYHWSGSDYAGPGDPLYGGGLWAPYSLDASVTDYRQAGAPADRIILGLPLYGLSWPVSSHTVPAPTTGRGSSIIYATAWSDATGTGAQLESASRTPYYDAGGDQVWYGHTASVRERVQYANAEGLAGFGFWALHYTGDDPWFWGMIHDETALGGEGPTDPVDPSDPLVANAGRPFLAYPGDTVVLTAEGSRVPASSARYAWTQVAGPSAALSASDAVDVSFVPALAGTYVFELNVGDGSQWSAADRTHVIVVDRAVGHRYRGCAVAGGPWSLGALWPLLWVWTRRRRG